MTYVMPSYFRTEGPEGSNVSRLWQHLGFQSEDAEVPLGQQKLAGR